MSYRKLQKPVRKPNRTMQATATPSRLFIHNGATAEFAVPCWYKEMRWPIRTPHHSRPLHDHHGWPTPSSPDASCQPHDFSACGNWDRAKRCCRLGHTHAHCPHQRRGPGMAIDSPPHGLQLRHGSVPDTKLGGRIRHCNDFLDMRQFFPIHLLEEGYNRVTVAFAHRPPGLEVVEAYIDELDDWIVRVIFRAEVDEAVCNLNSMLYTVKVHHPGGGRGTAAFRQPRTDIVHRGKLIILPTPWEEGDANEEFCNHD